MRGIRINVKWNTGTRVHKPGKGKGSYKREIISLAREGKQDNRESVVPD